MYLIKSPVMSVHAHIYMNIKLGEETIIRSLNWD